MEAARREREVAWRELGDAIRQAERCLRSDNPTSRLVKQRMKRIDEQQENLRRRHYTFLEKAKLSVENEDEVAYLEEKMDAAIDCLDRCMIFTEDQESDAEAKKRDSASAAELEKLTLEKDTVLRQLKTNITVEENFANGLVEKIKDTLAKGITSDILTSVKMHDDKLCETLENLDKAWKSLISVLEAEGELDDLTNVIADKKMMYQNVRSEIVVAMEKHYADVTGELGDSIEEGTSRRFQHNGKTSQLNLMRTEKMKLPSFSGNIRNYARFKRDFKDIVLPLYPDPIHQIFVIKENCLKGPARTLIENMEDMDAIWNRLDDKYGDRIDLVDVVIKELEGLPSMKGNEDQKFVQLVDALEKGLLDLEAINARQEIANAYTIKLVESKISRQLYLTWLKEEEVEDKDYEREGVPSSNSRFEKLYAFLKEERRRRMKLMKRLGDRASDKADPVLHKKQNSYGSQGTPAVQQKSPTQKCLIHPGASHFTRKCKIFLAKGSEERAAIIKETKGCQLCLSTEHLGKECPRKGTWGPCKYTDCGKYHSHLLHEACSCVLTRLSRRHYP